MTTGQTIYIAPREIQNTQQLLNTGWVLASIDNKSSGIIPLNYIQGPQQMQKQPSDEVPVPAVFPTQQVEQPRIFTEPNYVPLQAPMQGPMPEYSKQLPTIFEEPKNIPIDDGKTVVV